MIGVATAEGLMSESEAKVLRELQTLHARLSKIHTGMTPKTVETRLSKAEGYDKPQIAFEANVISLNAYRLLLTRLNAELREKGLDDTRMGHKVRELSGEVETAHDTIKVMCDLGHLKHQHLFQDTRP